MSTITVKDGTTIYYKDWGEGPVVTLSHGWPLNSDMWDGQMMFLAQHGFRVVAHDRRGHGRSSQPWFGNDMDGYSKPNERPREEEEMTTKPAVTEHEAAQVERANASNATPVVFVHGLWLLPSSWDRWVTLFEEAGYVALTPGWPDDPDTVAQAREHPEVFAGKGIGEIADYEEAIIRRLVRRPVIIGHSFGGLLTMILAGRGLAAASVAISPAPFRGVLPLPIAALRTASVALRNPANWNRAVPLTYDQFRYSFANMVGEDEAKELYLGYSVPGAGEPLFQAASANLNPWSAAKVNSTNPERGPMLIISADSDHTVPWAIANAAYKKQKRNPGMTEIVKMPGRGHALTIDAGWREVAEKALEFLKRSTTMHRRVA